MSRTRFLAALSVAVPFILGACAPLPNTPAGGGTTSTTGATDSTMSYLSQQTRDEDLGSRERREIQQHLQTHGYNIGTADGVIGQRSRDGIRGFQAASGLPVTGLYSLALLENLRASSARLGTPLPAGSSTGVARSGGSSGSSSGTAATGRTTGGGTATSGGTASSGGRASSGGGTVLTSSGGGAVITGGGGSSSSGGGGGIKPPVPGGGGGGGGGGGW